MCHGDTRGLCFGLHRSYLKPYMIDADDFISTMAQFGLLTTLLSALLMATTASTATTSALGTLLLIINIVGIGVTVVTIFGASHLDWAGCDACPHRASFAYTASAIVKRMYRARARNPHIQNWRSMEGLLAFSGMSGRFTKQGGETARSKAYEPASPRRPALQQANRGAVGGAAVTGTATGDSVAVPHPTHSKDGASVHVVGTPTLSAKASARTSMLATATHSGVGVGMAPQLGDDVGDVADQDHVPTTMRMFSTRNPRVGNLLLQPATSRSRQAASAALEPLPMRGESNVPTLLGNSSGTSGTGQVLNAGTSYAAAVSGFGGRHTGNVIEDQAGADTVIANPHGALGVQQCAHRT